MKLLSKNGDDPTVQSLGIDRFLGWYSEKTGAADGCSLFLLSLFYSFVLSGWWLPKNVYTNTLVSQVNKKLMTYIFWALFDGLSSWAKENKPNI